MIKIIFASFLLMNNPTFYFDLTKLNDQYISIYTLSNCVSFTSKESIHPSDFLYLYLGNTVTHGKTFKGTGTHNKSTNCYKSILQYQLDIHMKENFKSMDNKPFYTIGPVQTIDQDIITYANNRGILLGIDCKRILKSIDNTHKLNVNHLVNYISNTKLFVAHDQSKLNKAKKKHLSNQLKFNKSNYEDFANTYEYLYILVEDIYFIYEGIFCNGYADQDGSLLLNKIAFFKEHIGKSCASHIKYFKQSKYFEYDPCIIFDKSTINSMLNVNIPVKVSKSTIYSVLSNVSSVVSNLYNQFIYKYSPAQSNCIRIPIYNYYNSNNLLVDTYIGDIHPVYHRHGYGHCNYYNSKNYYKGEFKLNLRHGKGEYYDSKQNTLYIGNYKLDVKDGNGELYFYNYDHDTINKTASRQTVNGGILILKGIFNNNQYLPDSYGKIIYRNGDCYFGQITKHLTMSGYGVCFYTSLNHNDKTYNSILKEQYYGYWLNNKYNGNGTYLLINCKYLSSDVSSPDLSKSIFHYNIDDLLFIQNNDCVTVSNNNKYTITVSDNKHSLTIAKSLTVIKGTYEYGVLNGIVILDQLNQSLFHGWYNKGLRQKGFQWEYKFTNMHHEQDISHIISGYINSSNYNIKINPISNDVDNIFLYNALFSNDPHTGDTYKTSQSLVALYDNINISSIFFGTYNGLVKDGNGIYWFSREDSYKVNENKIHCYLGNMEDNDLNGTGFAWFKYDYHFGKL